MHLIAGIRRGLTATGSDEGRTTRKCRSVRFRPLLIPYHEREYEHTIQLSGSKALLTARETETDPIPDQVQVLAQEVYAIDLLPLLANNLHRLDFEVNAPLPCLPRFRNSHPASTPVRTWLTIDHC